MQSNSLILLIILFGFIVIGVISLKLAKMPINVYTMMIFFISGSVIGGGVFFLLGSYLYAAGNSVWAYYIIPPIVLAISSGLLASSIYLKISSRD